MRENTGKTKYIILGLLAHGQQTGYTMKKAIEYEHSHFWQESYGQIYPTLKHLVGEGLAEIIESPEHSNGRGQKQYGITEAGRTLLAQWLAEAPDVEKLRYEILIKVSFGESTEPQVILKHLDDFIRRNEESILEMDKFLLYFDKLKEQEQDHTYKELTALSGKYLYTAMKEWALEAKKIIYERKVGKP
ncbi:PadR family transcriptional regulator [Aminipila butyrica]|uniref:PadR family transcriptional regulator n=1 Tax=Aminipila butyrica TaxID=433296 RepID=A0A858BY04_9FIRM|nr:PadR family transcriptional regulator [Aminipila butyrica]QIB70322.1 PadR family transcriptional regulator [Aminipila butyrica]